MKHGEEQNLVKIALNSVLETFGTEIKTIEECKELMDKNEFVSQELKD
jgi:penicillin V acylase-like amidase (Ntn superfamily)